MTPVPRRILPVIAISQFAGTSVWFAINAVMADLQRDVAPERLALMLRSAAYGMARMHVDGQLVQWGVSPRSARRELQATLNALIDGFRR